MFNNKEVYSTLEFAWGHKQGLMPKEKFLIEKYLDKHGKTLEAGTGGGRILLEMRSLGFTSLNGFDYLPTFIELAKQKDPAHSISFEIQDATNLDYEGRSFDQIIYLQQIMSMIEDDIERLKAFREAYRILKNGGTAIFSFLNFDDRMRNLMYQSYLYYIRFLRKLFRSKRSIQYLPWLKHNGKPNLAALLDKEPYVYWYKIQEAYQILTEVNFEVVAIGSVYQIEQEKMYTSLETLAKEPTKWESYFVCKKY